MKNQAKQKAANDDNELGNRLSSPALTLQNELFYQVGEDSFTSQFNLGKTEEQILIDIVGKLTIPGNSLNTIRPLPVQN